MPMPNESCFSVFHNISFYSEVSFRTASLAEGEKHMQGIQYVEKVLI